LKKIIFLIIASLLVLGLVLPGCTEPTTTPRTRPVVAGQLNVAVCGPMDDVQGEHHWAGAQLAKDEINALTHKIEAGGTLGDLTVVLHEVDTNEIHGLPDEGVLALSNAIANVDVCVGGFRTEAVSAYRLEAINDQVMFLDCGAATSDLQMSVVDSYSKFKYWFKATPYNEVFLCTSMLKLTGSLVASLVGNLVGYHTAGYPYWPGVPEITGSGTHADPYVVKVAIFGESLSWAAGIVDLAKDMLPDLVLDSKNITMDVVGTWLVSDTATQPTVATALGQIDTAGAHVIFTIFSGPVGKVFSKERADSGVPALPIGINVEGQLQTMADYTNDGCEFDCMLDTWGYGVNQTPVTAHFLPDIMGASYLNGEYPLYTAATYDAIYALKAAIEGTNSLEPSAMIPYMEDISNGMENSGSRNTTYYQMWDGSTKGDYKAGTPDEELNVPALNQAQVLALYPWLQGLTIKEYGKPATTWTYNADNWTTSGGFIAHDTVYGPAYQTGQGTQWQDVGGTLRKVGWWPTVIPGLEGLAGLSPEQLPPTYQAALWEAKLLDQYGNWNFAYDGQVPAQLPLGRFLAGGAPTVYYDGTPVP